MNQLFKPGQDIVCIKDNWTIVYPVCQSPDYIVPKANEIYTVDQYHPVQYNGKWYLTLRQFFCDCLFHEKEFAPVMIDKQLANELDSIFHSLI